jgi:hypothetical protein
MEAILTHCQEDPVKMTYLGIGSAPRAQEVSSLNPKEDQLIPLCFHELLANHTTPMRILHFDPWFEKVLPFLHEYFQRWQLIPVEFPGGFCWLGDSLEVILISERIDHAEDFWFLETLCQTILKKKGKLVIQEYTGYELKALNERLYETATNKELFKKRVLLDMTYGTDTGCCTDMTKVEPFYDSDGNFLNLHFLNPTDALRAIGISTKVDAILKQKYVGLCLQSLNNMHVDYRRRLKGETLMFGSDMYKDDSTPEEIMRAIQTVLTPLFEILTKLRMLGPDEIEKKNSLFLTYKSHDPYKWYDGMQKLIPRP